MRRADLLAAVVVIGLAAWAVIAQLSGRSEGPPAPTPALAVGEAVPPDVRLAGLDGGMQRLGDRFGRVATVLYAWSTTCPCIPWCEEELKDIAGRYGPDQGIQWVAIDGEPTDTVEGIRQTLDEIGAFYDVLLDPSHRLCARLGFDRAALAVVLDADGYIRFRGNPSDRLKDPERWFLNEVLADVSSGRPPQITSTEPTYGCEFSAPIACEDEAPDAAAP